MEVPWHANEMQTRAVRTYLQSSAFSYAQPTATPCSAICTCSARESCSLPSLPSRAVGEREEAERSLQQARVAAGRREWERVRDLSSRAAALQRGLEATHDLC